MALYQAVLQDIEKSTQYSKASLCAIFGAEKSGITWNSILRGYNEKHAFIKRMGLFEVTAM